MSALPSWQIDAPAEGDLVRAHALLAAHGWGHRIGTVAQFRALVAASQRVVVAWSDGELVGFGRALTDGLANGYVSMLLVHPKHRGRGIGRALVNHLLGDDSRLTWVLRAGRAGAAEFFAKLGFMPSTEAMERSRLVLPGAATVAVSRPIAAVMVHVGDVAAGLAWYRRAWPEAQRGLVASMDFEFLVLDGIRIEIVPADEKVASGACGAVVYWRVAGLMDVLARLQGLGASLYRGPLEIEDGLVMCQVRDPWGNCIGLRGPR